MSELSRSQFPPGGWEFYQPQTRWSAPTPKSSTFDQTVIHIVKHRLANGAITAKHSLSIDVATVGNELEAYTRQRLGMAPAGSMSPKTQPRPPLTQVVAEAAAGVRKVAEGAAPLIEWLGSGGIAVPPEQAAARAEVCAGCPKNEKGGFTRWFTIPASEMIRKELSRRSDLKLSTPKDEELGVCVACYCPMKLKVHTPLQVITKHLKAGTEAELDPRCWILAERNGLQTPHTGNPDLR